MSRKEKVSERSNNYDPLQPGNSEDDGWSSFKTHTSFYESVASDLDWLNDYREK